MANTTTEQKWLNKISKRLKELRKAKGWTLEQAEEHGGMDWRHIQRLETNGLNMNMLTLYRLAKVYGVTPSDILKGIK